MSQHPQLEIASIGTPWLLTEWCHGRDQHWPDPMMQARCQGDDLIRVCEAACSMQTTGEPFTFQKYDMGLSYL